MDVTRSTQMAFAYTVKTLGTQKYGDYEPFFNKLKRLGIKMEYRVDEFDSKGKLHYHGILYTKKGFYRKKMELKGYHLKLVELTDRKGWLKYIHKDVLPEDWPDLTEYIEEARERPSKATPEQPQGNIMAASRRKTDAAADVEIIDYGNLRLGLTRRIFKK